MSSNTNTGLLCYKPSSDNAAEIGKLCFCIRDGEDKGKLIYRRAITHIYIKWYAPNRDLDICAYWTIKQSMKVGWAWNSAISDGVYSLKWYGDDTTVGGTEHVLPIIEPTWDSVDDDKRVMRIHLNYYGESETNLCDIRAVSDDGLHESIAESVVCNSRRGKKADVTDPYVTIYFDKYGRPTVVA